MGKRSDAQVALFVEEQFKELELINKIRQKVKEWRDGGYKGVTGVTERRVSGQVRVFWGWESRIISHFKRKFSAWDTGKIGRDKKALRKNEQEDRAF